MLPASTPGQQNPAPYPSMAMADPTFSRSGPGWEHNPAVQVSRAGSQVSQGMPGSRCPHPQLAHPSAGLPGPSHPLAHPSPDPPLPCLPQAGLGSQAIYGSDEIYGVELQQKRLDLLLESADSMAILGYSQATVLPSPLSAHIHAHVVSLDSSGFGLRLSRCPLRRGTQSGPLRLQPIPACSHYGDSPIQSGPLRLQPFPACSNYGDSPTQECKCTQCPSARQGKPMALSAAEELTHHASITTALEECSLCGPTLTVEVEDLYPLCPPSMCEKPAEGVPRSQQGRMPLPLSSGCPTPLRSPSPGLGPRDRKHWAAKSLPRGCLPEELQRALFAAPRDEALHPHLTGHHHNRGPARANVQAGFSLPSSPTRGTWPPPPRPMTRRRSGHRSPVLKPNRAQSECRIQARLQEHGLDISFQRSRQREPSLVRAPALRRATSASPLDLTRGIQGQLVLAKGSPRVLPADLELNWSPEGLTKGVRQASCQDFSGLPGCSSPRLASPQDRSNRRLTRGLSPLGLEAAAWVVSSLEKPSGEATSLKEPAAEGSMIGRSSVVNGGAESICQRCPLQRQRTLRRLVSSVSMIQVEAFSTSTQEDTGREGHVEDGEGAKAVSASNLPNHTTMASEPAGHFSSTGGDSQGVGSYADETKALQPGRAFTLTGDGSLGAAAEFHNKPSAWRTIRPDRLRRLSRAGKEEPLASPSSAFDHILQRPYEDVSSYFSLDSKVLATGQFGALVRCSDLASGEQLACKTVFKRNLKSPLCAKDIRSEVACLEALSGTPNIISLKKAFEDRECIHIVMELCQGGDLLEFVEKTGCLTESEAATVCRSLAAALMACHKEGIVHRDVKPENVLLPQRGCLEGVKLGDLGVATRYTPGVPVTDFAGTPEYMAPEVFQCACGPEADVWSLGALLHFALCGSTPTWDTSPLDVDLKDNMVGQFLPDSSKWAHVSESCKDLIQQMLCFLPQKRITLEDILRHPWPLEM